MCGESCPTPSRITASHCGVVSWRHTMSAPASATARTARSGRGAAKLTLYVRTEKSGGADCAGTLAAGREAQPGAKIAEMSRRVAVPVQLIVHTPGSSRPDYRQHLELLPQHRLGRRVEPLLQDSRVDAAEVDAVLHVAVIEVR